MRLGREARCHMKKQEKWFRSPADPWCVGTVEQWLEEQAAEGWFPVSFAGRNARFRRGEPADCVRFRIEPWRSETTGEQEAREAVYQEMNWKSAGIWGDYRVYYTEDPNAPELYSDSETLLIAWEKHLRRLLWGAVLYVLFWVAYMIWYSVTYVGMNLRNTLCGGYLLFVAVAVHIGFECWDVFTRMQGVRRVKAQLKAGFLPQWDTPEECLRRRRKSRTRQWIPVALVVFMLGMILELERNDDMVQAEGPLPYVTLMELDESATEETLASREYRSGRSLFLSEWYRMEEWERRGSDTEAHYDRLRLEILAEWLYDNQLKVWQKRHPNSTVEAVNDARFEEAVLVSKTLPGGTRYQAFAARSGNTVFCQSIYTDDGDLSRHLDDFAALMQAFSP